MQAKPKTTSSMTAYQAGDHRYVNLKDTMLTRQNTYGVTNSMITERKAVVEQDYSIFGTIMSTFYLLGNRRMLHILPLIIWSGLSFAYWFDMIAVIIASKLPDDSLED